MTRDGRWRGGVHVELIDKPGESGLFVTEEDQYANVHNSMSVS